MADPKPTTAWSVASLVVSVLGWLAAVPLLFIDYNHLIGATAGVGLIGPFLLGLVSGTLALTGIILGMIALARTRSGEFVGRGTAWTGIGLSGVLLAAYVVSSRFLLGLW